MQTITRNIEKSGANDVLISAIGYATCILALGVFGIFIGLRILAGYEGLFINKSLPIFAMIALIANCWGCYTYRNHHREMLSIIGP